MRTLVRASLALLVLGPAIASGLSAQATARWYIGTYSHDMLVWDEASEQVVDRIQMRNPIPARAWISDSRDRVFVRDASGEAIEILDVAAGEVVDEVRLSHDDVRVRINAFTTDPANRKALMHIMRYTKLRDRYSVEGPFIVEYDLATRQVTDTVPYPEGPVPDNAGYSSDFRYSPDGKTLYFFGRDIVAVDPETYEEIDRWEMSQALEPGLGRASFGTASGTYDVPGAATSLFRMADPVQNRRLLGISRVRLSERDVDFFTLGPSEPVGNFALAPGGRMAYALYSEVGHYEFWEFDLEARRVTRRQPFGGRPRMGLQVSADGEKLYVHVAGNTIDVYDIDTFELLRTVEFDEDMTAAAAVIPGGSGR